ncbi:MAG: hypothetical protein ACOYYS_24610 [Chloroflexota bacterium]
MTHSIILHIQGEDPVMGEVENLPTSTDVMVQIANPRRIDGKDLHYLAENVVNVWWPVHRLNFIEIMPSRDEEEIFGFVRE